MVTKKKAVKKYANKKKQAAKKAKRVIKTNKNSLDEKHQLFAREYIIDFNGTRAGEACGYSKKTAGQQASRLLKNVNVIKYISKFLKERTKKTKIDAEYVLTRLHDMDNADPCDILNEETGAFLPVFEWPLVWRRMLSAMDVKEIMEFQVESGSSEKIGELVKFKFPDRLRILEVIGKHVDVQAFLQKIEVSENSDLADRLRRSRERAKGKRGKQ